ncbi:glycosyl transferase group 1 [Desulfovibrio ferrophilus]|uniref:Glycosyl transferase group 1 n=2 Tax=Desulfovibrio ferrophilus TaxID=241368 RepID=A0A2Z6AX93_9BACT|nr:glycosyl transferase group 1 [Desulfovibrio ferrophilus]
MGRNVANEAFLRALLRRDPFDAYHFFLSTSSQVDQLAGQLHLEFQDIQNRGGLLVRLRSHLPAALARGGYHCFHLSDCINYPAYLAALRNAVSPDIFPITGVTHSLSYQRYSRDFLAHLWPGCTPRDCVIATSKTAVKVVDKYYDLLSDSYGGLPRPTVARIPLGVDTDQYRPPSPAERDAARAKLDLDPEQTMILVFARLSHFSKMDLIPLLRAMQRLPRLGVPLDKVRVVLAGWMGKGDETYVETVSNLAGNLGLPLMVVPKPDDRTKRELFWGADVFLSPVDNPQETFGLTVLEAGAMGLPAVVSEYDGYRDLVVEGETGYLIPTLGPESTDAIDVMAPLLFDNEYHLHVAQQTVVDVAAMAKALARLALDPALRRRLGEAGRQRMLDSFSWERVVDQHVVLWHRLRSEPIDSEAIKGTRHPHSLPIAKLFESYPSNRLDDFEVQWSPSGQAVYRGHDFVSIYRAIAHRVNLDNVKKVVFMARKPISGPKLTVKVIEILGKSEEDAQFLVLWCLKNDLLERVDDGS